jgi:hypothetical protein
MNDFTFLSIQYLWLLLLIPLWISINYYHQKQSLLDLHAFRKIPIKKHKQYLDNTLMLITIIALIIALGRPAWDPQPEGGESQGRDMVFLLDVSRSMLVEDARPNRLTVARQAIRKTINASSNDRFGLVVFAGSTSIQSPLTNDKTFFNYLLDQVNTDSVAQGGTRIEDALLKVLDKMNESDQENSMDIILISDGEDLGSQPKRVLNQLNKQGSRLIVIGLGDSEFGGRVPARDGGGWQHYQGKEVWSTMNTLKLRELAQGAEQGMFIPIGTATFDLAKIIEKLRQVWPSSERNDSNIIKYHQGYPYCLFIALLAQMFCWLRGRKFWLTAFALLSFNSQALIVAAPNNDSHNEKLNTATQDRVQSDGQVNISPDYLSQLTTLAQFQLAQSFIPENPQQAAEVYRYIASETSQSKIVIKANYNFATSLILYAETLSQQLATLNTLTDEQSGEITDESLDMFDDEEFIDPEIYYDQASDILRTLLLHAPEHLASQQNLEWLMVRAEKQKQDNQQQSAPQKSTDEQQKQQDEKSEQEQQSEQDKNQEAEQTDNESQQSKQSQQDESSALQLGDIDLPPPGASADEILKAAKERNLTERAPKNKKQTSVERDW